MSISLCKMMKSRIKSILAVMLSATILILSLSGCTENEPLLKPKNVSATLSDGGITVSWDYDGNADYFRVFRKAADDDDYKYIDDTTMCEYADKSIKPGIDYSYKIKAVCEDDISDGVSTAENIRIEIQEKAYTIPEKTVIASVTRMDKYTNVIETENLQEDCRYEITRADAKNGNYVIVGTTEDKYFYDETAQGKANCWYKVTAVNPAGSGEASNAAKVGTNAKRVFNVPVLMYHEFVTQEDLDSGVAFDEYAIWKDEFEKDLVWLKANGYTTITSEDLLRYMNGEANPPKKPVILTIDDGKYGVYKNAYPLLEKYNMKAVLAVIGYEIDDATENPEARVGHKAPYCTWDEIGEMSKSGYVEIISHTQDLHIFEQDERQGANIGIGETVDEYLTVAQFDFLKLNKSVKAATGKSLTALAYPYSKRSENSDLAWLGSGYKILFAGDDDKERLTFSNYFVLGAGSNLNSAVLRRIARMTKTPASEYIIGMINHDK